MSLSKRELVILVSRALAAIQVVTALMEMTYLPDHLLALSRHIKEFQDLPIGNHLRAYDLSVITGDRVALAFLVLRIGILCLATLAFWICSPRIEKILLPPESDSHTEGVPAEQ